jgi:hypothetical protein
MDPRGGGTWPGDQPRHCVVGAELWVNAAPSEARWHGPFGHDWLVRIWQGPTVDVGVASLEMPAAAGLQKVDVSEDVLQLLPHAPWRGMVRGSIDRAKGGSFWELRAFGWPCKCVAAGYWRCRLRDGRLGWAGGRFGFPARGSCTRCRRRRSGADSRRIRRFSRHRGGWCWRQAAQGCGSWRERCG